MFETRYSPIKNICEICGKSTINDGLGITWNKKYYCINCYELISGKKAKGNCLN